MRSSNYHLDPDMRTFPGKAREGVRRAGLAEEGERHGRAFGSRFGLAAKAAFAGLGVLVAFKGFELFKDIVKEGAAAARTNRIVEAAIKSTGGAAHVSAKQVEELTKRIGDQAGVEDSVVKAGTAMLLTFRNVRNEQGKGNDIFDRANKTLVDMTAALHGGVVTQESLRKQAIQLGKALNDPVKGLTALQRVGVTFTEGQKKQIAALAQSGHRLDAQKIILRELGKEFGGAAAASASPMQKLKARFDNFKESLGTALLPVLNTFVIVLAKYLMPALSQFADWFQNRGASALRRFGQAALPAVIEAIKTFAVGIATIVKGFSMLPGPVKIAIVAIAALAAAFYVLSANPVIAIIGGVILLTGLIVKHWGTIKRVTLEVWGAIFGFLRYIWASIMIYIRPLLDFFGKTIPHAFGLVLTWVRQNWPWLLGALTGPIGLAVVWIIKHSTQLRQTFGSILGGIKSDTAKIWDSIWRNTISRVANGIAAVIRFFKSLPDKLYATLSSFGALLVPRGRQLIQGLDNGVQAVYAQVRAWFLGMGGRINGFFRGALNWLNMAGRNVIQGLWNGLLFVWHKVTSFISGIASWIKSHKGPISLDQQLLRPAGEAIMKGLHTGLVTGSSGPFGFIAGIAGTIGDMLSRGVSGLVRSVFVKDVGGGVARWAGLVAHALRMEGLPTSLTGQVLRQIATESGGNPNAINLTDINARRGDPSRGLLQTIGSTFRAYHWPGTSWNIYDPLANIAAAINYARHVYGPNLMSGGMGLGSGHGYAAGGAITEPIVGFGRSGRRYTFGEAGEETVVPGRWSPAGIEARLEALIDAVQRNALQTGDAVAGAINGASHSAAYAARYSVG